MIETLFTIEALGGAARSLLTGLLSDKLKAKLGGLSQQTLDNLFEKAVQACAKELKPEKRKALRQAFRDSKVADKMLAFQEYRTLIPDDFFVEMFAPVVGNYHAKALATGLFVQLRKLIAREQTLQNEISSLHSEIILDLLQKQVAQLQHQGKNVSAIKETVERLEALLEKRADAATAIGSTDILPLPEDFVSPDATLQRVRSLDRNVVLLHGPPGAGKSVAVAALAHEAEKENRPVFWYRFRPLLDDHNSVLKRLTAFLQQEQTTSDSGLQSLLQNSRALLVFDDLHYVSDDKLQQFLASVAESGAACRLLFTSRQKSKFLPLARLQPVDINGLSEAETEALLQTWKLALTTEQLGTAKKLFRGNPQYLIFFREWHKQRQPQAKQIDAYFRKAFDCDDNLHLHLMNELYDAMGGGDDSNLNRLLQAAAFCRMPETRVFIERLYTRLGGAGFAEALPELQVRRHLLTRAPDSERYDLHDLLRQFYYDRTADRKHLHKLAAEMYQERCLQEADLIDFIESAHHYRKAGEHETAARQMQHITHYCTVRGLFWQVMAEVLDRLAVDKVADVTLRAKTLYDRGNLRYLMARWQEALADLQACVQINPGQYGALNSIGLVYQSKGEWDKAIELYNKDLEVKEQVEDRHGMAITYGNLGMAYQSKGEWDKAIEFYDKGLEGKEQVGDLHGMSKTYNNLGLAYRGKGEWDKALEFYDKALTIDEQVGDLHGMAITYGNLGVVYHSRGEWDKAVEFYSKSLRSLAQIGDWHGMAQTHNNLGLVYKSKGEWDKAIEFYNKSLEGKEQVGDRHGMAIAYGNLGVIYKSKGEWDKAIEFYSKSLEGLEQVGDRHGMAQTYGNLGVVYWLKDEWDMAIEFHNKDLAICEQVGDVQGMSTTYGGLGLVYHSKGEWDMAIEFYYKSIKGLEQVGDRHGMANPYNNLGLAYKDKGEWDMAIEFYSKSLEGKEQVGDVHGMAQTYGNIGSLKFQQKEYEPAIRLLLEVLLLFAKLGSVPEVSQAQGILSDFREQMGGAEFDRLSQNALGKIVAHGVRWGRHEVVSAEEARGLWQSFQAGK